MIWLVIMSWKGVVSEAVIDAPVIGTGDETVRGREAVIALVIGIIDVPAIGTGGLVIDVPEIGGGPAIGIGGGGPAIGITGGPVIIGGPVPVIGSLFREMG